MRIFRVIVLAAFLLLGLSANSQASRIDTIKMICQNWRIKQLDQTPIDNELKEDWEEMIKYSRTELRQDKTFIETNGETSEKGKWSLDSSGREITFMYNDGEKQKWIILEISSSALRFKIPGPGKDEFISGTLIPVKN